MSKRVTLVLSNLGGGGAERVAITLARELSSQGYSCNFFLKNKEGELLPEAVSEFKVYSAEVRWLRGLVLPLKRFFEEQQPDIVLVSIWPLTVFASIARFLSSFRPKLIFWEHSMMSMSPQAETSMQRFFMRLSMTWFYRKADAIVTPTQGVARDIASLSGVPHSRISVIPNPAAMGILHEKKELESEYSSWKEGKIKLVTVGKLKAVKNHKLLIEALGKLPLEKDYRLLILGEGELRDELSQHIQKRGLSDRVYLAGFHKNPYPFYLHADLFVLSSNSEGFGNVLIEALECGLPCVSTDCESGPREILDHGKFGSLTPVGDAEKLADAIQKELSHPSCSIEQRKARAAQYSPHAAAEQFRSLFSS